MRHTLDQIFAGCDYLLLEGCIISEQFLEMLTFSSFSCCQGVFSMLLVLVAESKKSAGNWESPFFESEEAGPSSEIKKNTVTLKILKFPTR